MKVYRCITVIFIALSYATNLPALAAEWKPLRVVITDRAEYKGRSICDIKRTKTIGLDLGLWHTGTCTAIGVQIAPVAHVQNMYGVELGLLFSLTEIGYGLQIGGLLTMMEDTDNRSYVIQVAGVVNNPAFMYPPSINGAQIAALGNAAGHLNGTQVGTINFLAEGHALQAGLCNIQVSAGDAAGQLLMQFGGYNTGDDIDGLQFGIINSHGNAKDETRESRMAQIGIFNYAYNIRGFQAGVVNRAVKLSGVQLGLVNMVSTQKHLLGIPFSPILYFAW